MPCNRRSIRLKEYDYSQDGAYFLTICTHEKICLFREIVNGKMVLNHYGELISDEWVKTEQMRKNISLDIYAVMPNHIHGIINIVGAHRKGTLQCAPTCTTTHMPPHNQIEKFGRSTSNSIPTIAKLFKSATTKQINILRHTPGNPVWQRNYYEHIIRDEHDLERIREYIVNNPAKWEEDDYYGL